jgi:hypothetical protein
MFPSIVPNVLSSIAAPSISWLSSNIFVKVLLLLPSDFGLSALTFGHGDAMESSTIVFILYHRKVNYKYLSPKP